jgi:c-di-GMP-binding flagellar brake protein YcgR
MNERRQHVRIDDFLEVEHWPWKSLFLSSSVSENISAGGLCFPSLQRFEAPQQIGISIHSPEFKDPITAFAQVVWLKEIEDLNYRYKVGVKFLKMSASHRARLLHHLCAKLEENNPQ